jgi:hypothetical protein
MVSLLDSIGRGFAREPMNRASTSSPLLLALALTGCAQLLDLPDTVECGSDDACTTAEAPCVQGECIDGTCAFTVLPEGTVVSELDAGDCQRQVCRADGTAEVQADASDLPVDPTAGDCQAPACTDQGTVEDRPAEDPPTDDAAGDCQRPACSDGMVVSAADDADLAEDTVPGDCSAPGCDDGSVVTVPSPSDTPTTDLPGDCLAPVCGAAGQEPDDADVPTSDCGSCDGGVIVPWAEAGADCYTGDPTTLDVGECQGGTWTCVDNVQTCEGQRLPEQEACGPGANGIDEDCDAEIDEDGPGCACTLGESQPCYTGPGGTLGIGTCSAGTSACMQVGNGNEFGACVGDVLPAQCDSCLDALDEDCANGPATCSGSHVFSRFINNVDNVTAADMVALPNGELLLFAQFFGSVVIGGVTYSSAGSNDLALVRYDSEGNPISAQIYGGTGNEFAVQLVLENDGYIAVATLGDGSAEDFGGGATFVGDGSGLNEGDTVMVKFDFNHNLVWKKILGGVDNERPHSAARMPDNGIVVLGTFEGTVNFGGSNLTASGSSDLFVARFDANGDHLWSSRYGGTGVDVAGSTFPTIAASSSGAIHFVFTTTATTVPFGATTFTNAGGRDGLLVKLLANGNVAWVRAWQSSSDEAVDAVTVLDDDSVWTAGRFGSAVNVDGVAGTDFSPTGTGEDLLLVRYDTNGNLLMGKSFNGTDYATVRRLSRGTDASLLLAGSFGGTLFTESNATPSNGSSDAMLLKLRAANGDLVWAKKHGGTGIDEFVSASSFGCGDIVATARYTAPASFGGANLPYTGSTALTNNLAFAKYRQ